MSQFSHHESALMATFSSDEQRRANRFIHPQIKSRFVVARGMLRHILAHYAQASPQALTFAYGVRGKPSLPDVPFDFNLAHSEDVAMLALAYCHNIGIDVEHISPATDIKVVARDYFSENEQAMLNALPTAEQRLAFYRCWTRKEAYIKARGDGFALALGRFDVTLLADDPPCLLRAEDDDVAKWQFFHLAPMDGYVGAVCVPVGEWMLEMHQLAP